MLVTRIRPSAKDWLQAEIDKMTSEESNNPNDVLVSEAPYAANLELRDDTVISIRTLGQVNALLVCQGHKPCSSRGELYWRYDVRDIQHPFDITMIYRAVVAHCAKAESPSAAFREELSRGADPIQIDSATFTFQCGCCGGGVDGATMTCSACGAKNGLTREEQQESAEFFRRNNERTQANRLIDGEL
jgi:hypothetical protein